MAAKVFTLIIYTEEEGMIDDYVPDMARLRDVNTELRLSERKAIIRCSKLAARCAERTELPEAAIMW
jgi:hypothetical protein